MTWVKWDFALAVDINLSLSIFYFLVGSQNKRKATDTEEEDDQSEKKYRKCEKAGCSAIYPVCFASASERYDQISGESDHFLRLLIAALGLVSGVLKMATRHGGIICHVASIFATSALITTTEGERKTSSRTGMDASFSDFISFDWISFIVLFFHVSHKDGYETFASWKKVWTSNGKSEPSLKAFMADQQLPYWV